MEKSRGFLERMGISRQKGKASIDGALKLAAELAPRIDYLGTKLDAIETAAAQAKK